MSNIRGTEFGQAIAMATKLNQKNWVFCKDVFDQLVKVNPFRARAIAQYLLNSIERADMIARLEEEYALDVAANNDSYGDRA